MMEYAFKMVKEIRLKLEFFAPWKHFSIMKVNFNKTCMEAKTEFVVKDVSYV